MIRRGGRGPVRSQGVGPSAEDRAFFAGPRSRRAEFTTVVRTATEMIRGFRRLHFIGPCITIFGSARVGETDESYRQAREIAAELGGAGYTIITGGGPGIMEAGNRGARDAGALSVGCTIKLPVEQRSNDYLDLDVRFHHFFVRKLMLVKYSVGFVVMKGGFGTGDEMFEALTLIQTGKIHDFPVVLVGTEYWGPLVEQLETMVLHHTIDPDDLDLLLVTDDVREAVDHMCRRASIRAAAARGFRRARRRGTAAPSAVRRR